MSAIQLLTKAGQAVDELGRLGSSTPAELAKAIDEPRPTVYRLVDALGEIGVARAADNGRVELGTALLRWGDAVIEAYINADELREQLTWVREQLGMNIYFCVPRRDGALCLDHAEGSVVDLLDLGPGRILPPHAGAASIALLAFGGDPVTTSGAATESELRTRLDRARKQGWALDDGEIVSGVAAVAVPVTGSDGAACGVVAAAGLREGVLSQAEAAAGILGTAAAKLGDAMTRQASSRSRVAHTPSITTATTSRGPALIVKAGTLMEALAADRIATSARLTELTGEPVTSVYRMLGTLTEIGWVEQISHRGAYRVGGKVLSLARELTRAIDIRHIALPIMTRIHQATGETAFLCVRNGTRAVCIERLDGVRVNSRVLRLGRSLPLHVGAAPRALLAFEDRQSWDDYAAIATQRDHLVHDVGSRTALYAQLDEVRALGYALSDNTVTAGIAAVGAPIFDHRGRVVASLSVSGLRDGILSSRAGDQSIIDLVRVGAHEISVHLGFDGSIPQ